MDGTGERSSAHLAARIDKYLIVGELAQGLTSRVYKVRHSETGNLAAIKMLNLNMIAHGDAVNRFLREANNLARLDHPNIARVLESSKTPDGRPYIVTEFVNGPTLERLIRDKAPLPLSRKIDLALQTCNALQAALRHNIIHCDVKPANILIDIETQEVKIVDFGLARAMWDDAEHPGVDGPAGTPRYMSPEQVLGQGMDHRSDIYSTGATFYHFFAEQPPFDAPTNLQLMNKHATAPVAPLQEIHPELPQDLCDVVMRMMAKDPNDRYQTYEKLIEALDAVKLSEMARTKTRTFANDFETYSSPSSPSSFSPNLGSMPFVGEIGAQPVGARPREAAGPYEYRERTEKGPPIDVKLNGLPREPRRSWVPVFVIVVGLLILLIMPTARDTDDLGGKISPIGRLTHAIARIVNPSAKEEVDPELVRMDRNYEQLKMMVDAVATYTARYGVAPSSCGDLRDKKIVSEADAIDPWGHDFVVVAPLSLVVSSGADGEPDTTDDWEMTFDGKLNQAPYRFIESLQAEHLYDRKGRLK
ncbi:serine/threonine protein kinase [Candidatus Sumerlaeota bacterium]|nr:serine/threonine protein kinase [Candidatus Sumerlaeota bacterium]